MPLPQPLDSAAVFAMHRAYAAALDRLLDRATAGQAADPTKREALRKFALEATRLGQPAEPGRLSELAAASVDAIERRTAKLRDPIRGLSRLWIDMAERRRTPEARYDAVFGAETRLYFPLDKDYESPVKARVAAALEARGYLLADYTGGYATDAAGKQRFKIGKLLKGVDDALYTDFQHDGVRTGGRMLVCLSRDPMDIARMSTGRAWWSCMSKGSMNFGYVKQDVRRGSLVAYLVAEDDPEIARPMARILLKPYCNARGERVLLPGRSYGLHNDAFERTADAIAQRLTPQPAPGTYRLAKGLYPDSMPERHVVVPEGCSAERALDLVKARWSRDADGHIRIAGDLDLAYCGMTQLPDLSNVTVTGSVFLENNRLTSLDGLPRNIGGSIDLSDNRLTALHGLPDVVHGDLRLRGNALRSLAGAPCRVEGDFSCRQNRLETLEGGPVEVKGSYYAGENALHSLAGAPPRLRKDFDVSQNRLTSLEGGPELVGGDYDCADNALAALAGAPRIVGGDLNCCRNRLRDIDNAPQVVDGTFYAYDNPLEDYSGLPFVVGRMRCDEGTFYDLEDVPEHLRQRAGPRPPRPLVAPRF